MINIISYCPSSGGNHLRNIVALCGRFEDQWPWDWVKQQSLGLSVYYENRHPQGEVQELPGRNLREVYIDQMLANHDRDYLIHGHFGELARYRNQLLQLGPKRLLILSLEDKESRKKLLQRQDRLGQQIHPYWLDEEQIYLYRFNIYQTFFSIPSENISTVDIGEFWNPCLSKDILARLESFFDVEIDHDKAQEIHRLWYGFNFTDL